MPEDRKPPTTDHDGAGAGRTRSGTLTERVQAAAAGLAPLLTQAEEVQRERATAAKERGAPRWTDVFTTQFTEFSNRPR
jgi:hypothetical protein